MAPKLAMHQAAVYRIRCEGALEKSWVRYLNPNVTVVIDQDDPERISSTLTGKLSDQAALLGLLTELHNLGLPLISVTCLSRESGAVQQAITGRQPV